eukprot:g36868.t1
MAIQGDMEERGRAAMAIEGDMEERGRAAMAIQGARDGPWRDAWLGSSQAESKRYGVHHWPEKRGGQFQLDPQIWGLVFDWVGLDSCSMLTVVARVCHHFYNMLADRRAWPSKLRGWLQCDQPVPEHVWRQWRSSKIYFGSVTLRPRPAPPDFLLPLRIRGEAGRLSSLSDSHAAAMMLARLSQAYPGIVQLDLSGCSVLTNSALAALVRLPLTHLDLSGCWRLTDRGLKYLQNLPLKVLHLAGLPLITDLGLRIYLTKLPLTLLDLPNCVRITESGVSNLRRSVPGDCKVFLSAYPTSLSL